MNEILCIDGPSGAGKGTVCKLIASELGYSYLDSGALYRILAFAADQCGYVDDSVEELVALAQTIKVEFVDDKVLFESDNISPRIRTEKIGAKASLLASIPEVRTALLAMQRQFANRGGLVADGRDMGTVVFPDARLKIFLIASAEERARRRYFQLQETDDSVATKKDANRLIHKDDGDSLRALVEEIRARDERDASRKVSPMRPAEDAIEIDSTSMAIEEVVAEVLSCWNQCSEN